MYGGDMSYYHQDQSVPTLILALPEELCRSSISYYGLFEAQA